MRCGWLILAILCSARALAAGQPYQGLFEQANEAFRAANQQADPDARQQLYHEAILAYERIVREGRVRNARLYYNLANAYLLKADIGRAILNYRRAERLDRTDENIQKNLAFALSRRTDVIPPRTEQQVLQILLFWHYDLPTGMRVYCGCLGVGMACLAGTAMVWLGKRRRWAALATAGVILCLAMAGSVIAEQYRLAHHRFGVITADQVTARQGDGPNYPDSFKAPLHAGTEFELLETRPGWIRIRLGDGNQCWIPSDAGELI